MAGRVTLLWCKQGTMRQGQYMRPHSHACLQLYYILAGSPVFHVSDLTFTAPAGSYFYVPRSATHSLDVLGPEGDSVFELKLVVEDPFLALALTKPAPPRRDDGVIRSLLQYVMRNYIAPDEVNAANIESIMTTVLLSFLVDDLEYKALNSRFITVDGYDAITRDILVYVEQHFPYPFTMEALSAHLNYSRNYLSTVFRRNTGRAIVEYLNLLRIRNAVIHFFYYGQDVLSTCESVGFSDISYFSRTFRKYTGVSPRRFKRCLATPGAQEMPAATLLDPITSYRI